MSIPCMAWFGPTPWQKPVDELPVIDYSSAVKYKSSKRLLDAEMVRLERESTRRFVVSKLDDHMTGDYLKNRVIIDAISKGQSGFIPVAEIPVGDDAESQWNSVVSTIEKHATSIASNGQEYKVMCLYPSASTAWLQDPFYDGLYFYARIKTTTMIVNDKSNQEMLSDSSNMKQSKVLEILCEVPECPGY